MRLESQTDARSPVPGRDVAGVQVLSPGISLCYPPEEACLEWYPLVPRTALPERFVISRRAWC